MAVVKFTITDKPDGGVNLEMTSDPPFSMEGDSTFAQHVAAKMLAMLNKTFEHGEPEIESDEEETFDALRDTTPKDIGE